MVIKFARRGAQSLTYSNARGPDHIYRLLVLLIVLEPVYSMLVGSIACTGESSGHVDKALREIVALG